MSKSEHCKLQAISEKIKEKKKTRKNFSLFSLTVSNIVSFCLQPESSGTAQTDFQRDRCLPEKRFVRMIIDCGHKSPTDDLRVLGVLFKIGCSNLRLVQSGSMPSAFTVI
ncbi:hypothetical protein T02_10181 [Trichinella nativa]|uniref:Uncharacterized protein n=1 Tax=Trichinella nativa TaxID=6335 RepID=A0A0V1KUD9_9BILA|nr:hypothetical protein T02_10181 [Trichinella nativa]